MATDDELRRWGYISVVFRLSLVSIPAVLRCFWFGLSALSWVSPCLGACNDRWNPPNFGFCHWQNGKFSIHQFPAFQQGAFGRRHDKSEAKSKSSIPKLLHAKRMNAVFFSPGDPNKRDFTVLYLCLDRCTSCLRKEALISEPKLNVFKPNPRNSFEARSLFIFTCTPNWGFAVDRTSIYFGGCTCWVNIQQKESTLKSRQYLGYGAIHFWCTGKIHCKNHTSTLESSQMFWIAQISNNHNLTNFRQLPIDFPLIHSSCKVKQWVLETSSKGKSSQIFQLHQSSPRWPLTVRHSIRESRLFLYIVSDLVVRRIGYILHLIYV